MYLVIVMDYLGEWGEYYYGPSLTAAREACAILKNQGVRYRFLKEP